MLSFKIDDSSIDINKYVSHQNSSYILQYPCDDLHQCSPYITTFRPVTYLLEVWGAQGGLNGGKGGYSKGIISFKKPTLSYIYIGAKGPEIEGAGITPESYNGGGSGSSGLSPDKRATGSGGGATDIRIIDKTENHRIIVAGGGGGCALTVHASCKAGSGGGINGGDGDGSPNAKGGTQYNAQEVPNDYFKGTFGKGGSADESQTLTFAGGGGGWYGGSSSQISSGRGGAGGSGYALHKDSYKPQGYQIQDEKYFFKYWELYSGDMTFMQCSGSYPNTELFETGHEGSGCARITILNFERCTGIYKSSKFLFYLKFTSIFILDFHS